MSTFQVAWNATTKVVKVQKDGDAPGAGFTDIGSFDHVSDPDDELGAGENHVLFHHVRDLLYLAGVENLQFIEIQYPYLVGISASPAGPVALDNAATQQLTITFDPVTAPNRTVSYVSSDITIATVSASGLITADAVNEGQTIITVTSEEGGFTDTVVVDVAAV